MSKRVLMIALAVGIGVAALQRGTAEAGTWVYLKPQGIWSYIGSIENCALITNVQNPANHLGRNFCGVTVTQVQSLCLNPATHDVRPGTAATKLKFFAATDVTSADMIGDKTQGKAAVCGSAPTADADCTVANPDPNLCQNKYCVNPNWFIQQIMTAAFRLDCQTQTCSSNIEDNNHHCCTSAGINPATNLCYQDASLVNDGWVTKDTNSCACTLPSGISITSPPAYHCTDADLVDPLHPNPQCIPWDCWALDAKGNVTTNRCQLPQ